MPKGGGTRTYPQITLKLRLFNLSQIKYLSLLQEEGDIT